MNRSILGWLGAIGILGFAQSAQAVSELQTYVEQCQSELHFNASDVPATMDCNTGVRFADSTGNRLSAINDYLIYKKVNDTVDLTVACRWLNNKTSYATGAISIEMLIHSRQNGSTCFFSAKVTNPQPNVQMSTTIVSPTVFPNADAYWLQPLDLTNTILGSSKTSTTGPADTTDPLKCVGCHSQGPYIASARIAPYLARFGLLNDGHDTFADMTALPSPTVPHYHAVGSGRYDAPNASSFGNWDGIVYGNLGTPPASCQGCHALGSKSTVGNLYPIGNNSEAILPSLKTDIAQLTGTLMPPIADDSEYHWINRDYPASDGMEIETFTASNNSFPVLPSYCGVPTNLEAHVVGSEAIFSTTEMSTLPDKLRSFTGRDGLNCFNSDQPAGKKCADYSVRYQCSDGSWTVFYNNDQNSTDDGDHETISSLALYTCGGVAPIAIQAQFTVNSVVKQVTGPGDRLQQFAPSGLICKNADQGTGQSCSNYVVRYRACRPKSDATLVKVKNQWVNPPTFTNRFLTTTNNVNNAEIRGQAENAQYPSQDWIVEKMANGNVRMKDVWSGKYLTVTNNNDLAAVVARDSDTALTAQQWVIETISGSADVRLKNVASARYLTVGNYTTDPYYAPIYSQSLSSQNWTSQRWLVQ
ncbi:MAG TPA: RICIN domain-containing protein [Polyangiaceae bacterium]|nr:RICIN domain-containing protein [Polyangiaceae bacterium]